MAPTAPLRRLAFARPTGFAVVAPGGREPWQAALDAGLCRPVPAPHDADLLVVAGDVPAVWNRPLARLFETFALPRAAVWLPGPRGRPPEGLPLAEAEPEALTAALCDPAAPGNRPLLGDRPPAPWRGLGDHGQGGEGMMGGKPYGRPMAMTGWDPDGLQLSDTPVELGPFFPGLPDGLWLRLRKQGERIRLVEAVRNLVPDGEGAPGPTGAARTLLCCAAQLRLLGLDALAERFRRARAGRDRPALARLFARAERAGILRALDGLGPIGHEQAGRAGLAGAAFAGGGDARARWLARRDLALGDAQAPETADDSRRLLPLLPGLLAGRLWSEAVLVLASLDLDMAEAAR